MPRTNTAKKLERIDARMTRDEKRTIETAARLKGTTVTEFVLSSAKEAAARAIRENEVLVLGEQDRKVFVEALLNPPKPTQYALEAVKNWRKRVR